MLLGKLNITVLYYESNWLNSKTKTCFYLEILSYNLNFFELLISKKIIFENLLLEV